MSVVTRPWTRRRIRGTGAHPRMTTREAGGRTGGIVSGITDPWTRRKAQGRGTCQMTVMLTTVGRSVVTRAMRRTRDCRSRLTLQRRSKRQPKTGRSLGMTTAGRPGSTCLEDERTHRRRARHPGPRADLRKSVLGHGEEPALVQEIREGPASGRTQPDAACTTRAKRQESMRPLGRNAWDGRVTRKWRNT